MDKKRSFERKVISLGLILLIATCLLQTTHGENFSGFDFSIIIENDNLTLQELVRLADTQKFRLSNLRTEIPNLDDVFLSLTGREMRE